MSKIKMPALFIGHGSPMNAIEDNEFSRTWIELGKKLPKPKGILCISAHWETRGANVTGMLKPRTIHDFYGFPPELNAKSYPAPGSPDLAKRVSNIITSAEVKLDSTWGLDHGTWSVLCRMYPEADIPVVQLSLDRSRDAEYHYRAGQEISALREEGILLLGSGNLVHNLRLVEWADKAFGWAEEFDSFAAQAILDRNHDPLIHYEQGGRAAALSTNSAEHYLPLLYILGCSSKDDAITFYNEKVTMGSISMRCMELNSPSIT
jgi:4,5-DOPA dioxygenase extradiol